MTVSVDREVSGNSGRRGGNGRMRFAGIDRGGERHAIAVVNEDGAVLTKPTFFT
jgi:hypothetical protein